MHPPSPIAMDIGIQKIPSQYRYMKFPVFSKVTINTFVRTKMTTRDLFCCDVLIDLHTVNLMLFLIIFLLVRLQNGGAFFGAVEVYYSNMWGTICPKSFGQTESSRYLNVDSLVLDI